MASYSTNLNNAIAQVFKVSAPETVPGLYVTKIDLFFKKKSNSFGVEVFLVNLDRGLPDPGSVLLGSRVTLNSEQVNVSDNANAATTFTFSEPVYLENGQRYAFLVKPMGNTPDYQIWTGLQGGIDVTTGRTISSNPLSESAYFSKSSEQWTELPGEDFKYKLYRAKFDRTVSNVKASFKKDNSEILLINQWVPVSGNPDIRPGDEVYKTSLFSPNTAVRGEVASFDPINKLLYLRNSTGNFTDTDSLVIIRPGEEANVASPLTGVLAYATVESLYDYALTSVAPKLGTFNPPRCSTNMKFRGVVNTGFYTVDTKIFDIINQEEIEFAEAARFVLSRSREVATIGAGNTSLRIEASLNSESDYISPIIRLSNKTIVGIRNLINANTAGEETNYGSAESRYISRVVTLADGQEAEDLKVFLTAYKPARTVLKVYAKLWNNEDPRQFDELGWTELSQTTSGSVYSDPKNPNDYREYEYDLPAASKDVNGIFQYTGPAGAIYKGYKKFSVKVVLAVENEADRHLYPKLNDLRAIALQV